MRFYEFATPVRPVLKISQQAQKQAPTNTPATPPPKNTPPTTAAPEPIRVYPRQWQRAWLQKYLAAQIAQSAQTIKPTEDDITIAMLRYGEAQRKADLEYERTHGVPVNPQKWEKRK